MKIKKLYTANLDNEVILFATDLNDFLEVLKKLEPTANIKENSYYQSEFLKTSIIPLIVSDFKVYNLQEVYNNNEK